MRFTDERKEINVKNFANPDDLEIKSGDTDRVIHRNYPVNLAMVNFIRPSTHEDRDTGDIYPAITFIGVNHKWVFYEEDTRDAVYSTLSRR